MEKIIKMMMDAPQPEAHVDIDPDLFGKFMQQIPIWDYSSISRESYVVLSNFEKKKLICHYYSDIKSRSRGNIDIIFSIMPNQFKSKDSVKLI